MAHNLALASETVALHKAMRTARIPVVVLKGVPLIRRLGLELGERSLADIDLLVRRSDVEAALRLLHQAGYAALPERPIAVDLLTRAQHLVVRFGPLGPICVELHWAAFSPACFAVEEETVWAHLEPQSFDGVELEVLDRPLTVLHTAAHFVQHCLAKPHILKVLGREWQLWAQQLNAAELRDLALATGTLHALDYSLWASAELGLTGAPVSFGSRRARAVRQLVPARALLDRRPEPDLERILISLLLLEPGRATSSLLTLLFPPAVEVRAKIGDVSAAGLAAHYAIRSFRAGSRCVAHRVRGVVTRER